MALQLPVKDGSSGSVQMYFTFNWGSLIQSYSFVPLQPANQKKKEEKKEKKKEVIHWNTSASLQFNWVKQNFPPPPEKSKKHPLDFHPILALIETSASCEMCHSHDIHSPVSLAGKNKTSAIAIKSADIGPNKQKFRYLREFNWNLRRSSYNCSGGWSIWQVGCRKHHQGLNYRFLLYYKLPSEPCRFNLSFFKVGHAPGLAPGQEMWKLITSYLWKPALGFPSPLGLPKEGSFRLQHRNTELPLRKWLFQ